MPFFGGRKRGSSAAETVRAYVEACLNWPAGEGIDSRDAWGMTDVSQLKMLASGNGSRSEAELARQLIDKYPDFHILYYWLSGYHRHRGELKEAIELLDRGIPRCIEKRDLCASRGQVCLEDGDLEEAVLWWLRAARLQEQVRTLDGYAPFMYLAYVAALCGLEKEARELFRRTDMVRQVRLNDDGLRQIEHLVENAQNGAVMEAVRQFVAV